MAKSRRGGGDKYNIILTFFFKNFIIFFPPHLAASRSEQRESVCESEEKKMKEVGNFCSMEKREKAFLDTYLYITGIYFP